MKVKLLANQRPYSCNYLNKDYILYVDKYTISALFIFLYKNETNACETIKKKQKGISIIQNKLKTIETSFHCSDLLSTMK